MMEMHLNGKSPNLNHLTVKVGQGHTRMIRLVLGMTVIFPFFTRGLCMELGAVEVPMYWYLLPAAFSFIIFLSAFVLPSSRLQRFMLPYAIAYTIVFIVIAYLQNFHLMACMGVWLTMLAVPLILPTLKSVNVYNATVILMFLGMRLTYSATPDNSWLLALMGLAGAFGISWLVNSFFFHHKQLKEEWYKEMMEAKKETKMLMDSLTVMVNYKDGDNTIVKVNRAQVEFMPLPNGKKIKAGDNLYDHLSHQDALKFHEEDKEIIRSQKALTNKVDDYALPCGGTKYVRTDKFPIQLKDGRQGVMTIGMDVTTVKEAELRIKASERRFRQMFENAPVAVRIRDLKKGEVQHNKAFHYMFGTQPHQKVLPGDVAPEGERADQIAWDTNVDAHTGTLYKVQRYRTPSGKTLITNAMITTVEDDAGKPELIISVWENITAREEAKEQLEEFTENLKESNKALEAFAYAVSHDLREPLRMITGYMQLLERRYKDQLDDQAKEFIHYAVDGAARMNGLITDLLQFSRVGRMYQKFSDVNLNSVSQKVLWDLQVLINEKQAVVNVGELPTIKANRTEMGVLFQNLIGNAIKYSREGVPPVVEVSCMPTGSHYYFKVQDNGIGIEKKNQEMVFALFHRLHGRDEYSGTGIGLAVCKKVVDRMNGKIWVESTPGEGSTFHFSLPKEAVSGAARLSAAQR